MRRIHPVPARFARSVMWSNLAPVPKDHLDRVLHPLHDVPTCAARFLRCDEETLVTGSPIPDGRFVYSGPNHRLLDDRPSVPSQLDKKLEAQQQLEHLLVCQTSQLEFGRAKHAQVIIGISAPTTDRARS